MVQNIIIVILSVFLLSGCLWFIPGKGKHAVIGEEVKTPSGYVDYMKREICNKEKIK